jgi:hypothetical protein
MAEPSPLEVLAMSAQVTREAKEEKLQALPRWRFRRRRYLESSLRHRQGWEQSLNEQLASQTTMD